MLNIRKAFIQGTGWTLAARFASQLSSVATSILVLRSLDQSAFGSYTLVLSWLTVVNVLAVSGPASVFGRYFPEWIRYGKLRTLRQLYVRGALFSVVMLGALLAAIYAFRREIEIWLNINGLSLYASFILVFLGVSCIQSLVEQSLRSMLMHKMAAGVVMIVAAIRLSGYVVFSAALSLPIVFVIESAALSFSLIASSVALLWGSRTSGKLTCENSAVDYSRALRYGIFAWFNEIGAVLVGRASDVFIIGAMSGPVQVALYGFASRINAMVQYVFPLKEVTSVLRPVFVHVFANESRKQELNVVVNAIMKGLFVIYAIPFAMFLVYGRWVTKVVFGSQYMDAVTVASIVVLGQVISGLFYAQGLVIILKERIDIALLSKGVALVTVPAGIVAMNYVGITGVAVMTLIGDFLRNWIMHLWVVRKYDLKFRWRDLGRTMFGLLAVILVAKVATPSTNDHWIVRSLWATATTVGLFTIAIFRHPFRSDEAHLVLKALLGSSVFSKLWKCPVVVRCRQFLAHCFPSAISSFR